LWKETLEYQQPSTDCLDVMDSRALVALAVGTTGFVLGLLTLLDGSTLGIFAGVASLGAGLIGWMLSRQIQDTERMLDAERRQAAGLEDTVTSQVQARISAEDAVRSLGSELAATQASEVERAERVEEQIREEVQLTGSEARSTITDPNTGLYTETYFRAAVEARVAAARRHLRPVAVVLMEVTKAEEGESRTQADPQIVADYVIATLRESDTACRTSKGLYALVLEDTPENGAVWTVERIRRRMAEENETLTLWAGIACYPAHAFEVRDLVGKASEALEAATEWHQDRIEVAVADL
jgi:diguanylate cyclase (GGDEF)-like protein